MKELNYTKQQTQNKQNAELVFKVNNYLLNHLEEENRNASNTRHLNIVHSSRIIALLHVFGDRPARTAAISARPEVKIKISARARPIREIEISARARLRQLFFGFRPRPLRFKTF